MKAQARRRQVSLPRNARPRAAEPREDGAAQSLIAARSHPEAATDLPLGRVPYITARAFCETPALVSTITQAAADRRLSRADVTSSFGGLKGALQFFAAQPTPDLLMIETGVRREDLFSELDALAEVCDVKTRVVLVGAINDISFYRQLVDRGISEYLVAPTDTPRLINVISHLFPPNAATRQGKVLAFIGAKGGTGSSTVAQNTAWSLSRQGTKVLLADLDLQFGTAALNYNIDAQLGFTEQFVEGETLDDAFFERVAFKYGPHLSVLAGATASRDVVTPPLELLDQVLERARAIFPLVVLDLPHQWSPWVRQALLSADEVIVTAEPDLANLRNGRMMFDLLNEARPNDADPRLVLNRIGMPRRAEIKPDAFATALQRQVSVKLRFEPRAFSTAAIGGRMLAEVSGKAGRPFMQLAQELSGMAATSKSRRFPLWSRGQPRLRAT
ncbi:AAA family ATPase [Paracoccus sp. S-4012]|uniref:AAA family ATPase n=1 Tax=Paracoccus sp. S-4012 TaxID=2665648 RepID=UPI001E5E73E5|nr:AAA family ATPase [Paracoccus sp. S-4012]